jgi:plasmid stability protein
MATLTIRDLDDDLKQRLRIRAAHRNQSMEEEARQILKAALLAPGAPDADLAQRIRARFAAFGGVVLPTVEREPVRPPPDFGAANGASGTRAVRNSRSPGRR